MEESTRTSSRRGLFGRALLLAGGALGVSAARSGPARGSTPPAGKGEVTLYGSNFHLRARSRLGGQVPVEGDRHSAYGQLLDRPRGKVIGHFTAAHLTQDSPFAEGASSLELHTFTLKEGTIHGLGSAVRGADGHFVILGGTGIYSGVQGSYVARQGTRELGGNGTAEFRLTLAGKEAVNAV